MGRKTSKLVYNGKEYYSIQGYADLKGVSVRTVYSKIEKKEVECIEILGNKFVKDK